MRGAGDEIFGRYRFPGESIAVSATGEIVFEADLARMGGTGRFEGASGEARSSGRANVFTGSFEIEMSGEVSLR